MMKYILLCISFINLFGAQSQTIDENYLDGVIYFKVDDASLVDLHDYEEGTIPALDLILESHEVTELIAPFKTMTDQLQRIYKLTFDDPFVVNDLIADLELLSFVAYAEYAPLYAIYFIPNDLDNYDLWALDKIMAPEAWDITMGSETIKIAILDNAVQNDHEDLIANRWTNPGETPGNGLDDDLNGFIDDVHGFDCADLDGDARPPFGTLNESAFIHGTHCAGIAAGTTNNTVGIASIGNQVQFVSVKCASDASEGNMLSSSYEGFDYALRIGADVVSMSFGSEFPSLTWNHLLAAADIQGVTLVGAAGNEPSEVMFYPAAYDGVIAVGATNSSDVRSGYSNHGDWIDVMAPGNGIESTLVEGGNTYDTRSGTSMACPVTAGLAGLVKSLNPELTHDEVKALIKDGADDIYPLNPEDVGKLGTGRINAFNTVSLVGSSEISENQGTITTVIYPNPSTDGIVRIKSDVLPINTAVYSVSGSLVYTAVLNTEFIDLSHLDRGTYFLHLDFEDGSFSNSTIALQ